MTDKKTSYPPTVTAILEAIETRLGWRATDEDRRAMSEQVMRIIGERGDGRFAMSWPDRVWARPFQGKQGQPWVAVTVFWGNDTLYVEAEGPK